MTCHIDFMYFSFKETTAKIKGFVTLVTILLRQEQVITPILLSTY